MTRLTIEAKIRGFVVTKNPKTGLFAVVDCTTARYHKQRDEWETREEAVIAARMLSLKEGIRNQSSMRM